MESKEAQKEKVKLTNRFIIILIAGGLLLTLGLIGNYRTPMLMGGAVLFFGILEVM